MPNEASEYKKMLTDLIKQQMVILGPNIALDKARRVPGVVIQDDGSVEEFTGDPRLIVKGVANEYMSLSGQIAQMTLNILLEKYPGIKSL